jgi:hypothetical protein
MASIKRVVEKLNFTAGLWFIGFFFNENLYRPYADRSLFEKMLKFYIDGTKA